MDSLDFVYTAAVLAAAGLAGIAIRAPQALWLRAGAVLLSGVLMVTAYAAFVELLGRPKPANLEWALHNTGEATVVAADMREGEAIYLWLRMDGADAPRAYALPWSMEAARQLHEAQGRAGRNGTEVRMRGPFRGEEGGERMFYATPQQSLPPKTSGTS